MYWLCYCVASCNQYLMLINQPTDGATRGLTLRVRLFGRNFKKDNIFYFFILAKFIFIFYFGKILFAHCSLIRSNTVYIMNIEQAARTSN